MRDRLRSVNCPSEMIDQIGGWSKTSVGEGYGDGFSKLSTMNFMQKIASKHITQHACLML
jgi:hypothetical protein